MPLLPLFVFILIFLLWTDSVFAKPKPKPKSVEESLGEALIKYLDKGVKIRKD